METNSQADGIATCKIWPGREMAARRNEIIDQNEGVRGHHGRVCGERGGVYELTGSKHPDLGLACAE